MKTGRSLWILAVLTLLCICMLVPAQAAWKQDSTGWYYTNQSGAKVKNAWKQDSKGWCYLGSDGYMLTNAWAKDSAGWCYLGSDGYAVTNCWKKDSIGWIWLNSQGSMAKSQWVQDGGKWYYMNADGYMVSNQWRQDSQGWCWLTASGAMATNQWVQDSAGWCYVGSDGYAVTNCWKQDSIGWIWLGSQGSMTKSQWVQDGGKWYYMDADGYMVTNWQDIDGSRYYFYGNGVMATNTTIYGVQIGSDGKVIETKTLTIGLPTNAKILNLENNALTKWLEEETGCNIEFILYAGGSDISTQIAVTVAAGQKLPDILFGVGLNSRAINSYGKDGYFIDLTSYFEDKDGASQPFWSRIQDGLTPAQQSLVIDSITDPNTGEIYGIPTVETTLVAKRQYAPWINQVWLDKLGLSMPRNIEELYNVLVAFKNQKPGGEYTIPLFGSAKAGGAAQVDNWLINMFLYYDPNHCWQDYDGDGELEYVYTQDAYREALKFINKLYNEELLTNMVYTCSSAEMKQITTPASGEAMCGIFCGNLMTNTAINSPVLYDYVPMPLWGYAVEGDISCNMNTFISADCENPDLAFQLLMKLWTWEGSMRVRYGELGVNWFLPDSGAKSGMGLDATYKLLHDPLTQQNSAHWGVIACCFNEFAEGETAQASDNTSEWLHYVDSLNSQSRAIFDAAVAANNPQSVCPTLFYTNEEIEDTEMIRSNISSYSSRQRVAFITGIGADINNDADWNSFLAELENLGLSDYQAAVQAAYERQTAK